MSEAQEKTAAAAAGAQAIAIKENGLAKARVFRYAETPGSKMANGAERREMVLGRLATGEAVEVHESVQPAGLAPNPAHVIHHSEFIVVVEGTMEYTHDGTKELANAGDVLYVAVGTNHSVRNAGNGPAKYVVFQISGDTTVS